MATSITPPFKNNSFDVVYTVNTLHHMKTKEEVESVLLEMSRAAKRHVIVFDFNPRNPYCKYILFKTCPYDEGDERIPTKEEIIYAGIKARLKLKSFTQFGFMPQFTPKFLMPFFQRLEGVMELKTSFFFRDKHVHF